MSSNQFIIIFVSVLFMAISGFLPGLRQGWLSLSRKPLISLLIFGLVVALLLGSPRGIKELAKSPVDSIRIARILILTILFSVSCLVILLNKQRVSNGWGPRWMLMYALTAIASSLYSPFPLLSLWKGFEVLAHMSVALMVGSFLLEKDDVQDVLNLILLLLWFFTISAIAGAIVSPEVAIQRIKGGGVMAFYLAGVYPPVNPNSLSQLSGLLAAIMFCRLLLAEKMTHRLGVVMVFIPALACLILSHSRTSLSAFLLAGCLIVFIARRKVIAIVGLWIGSVIALSGIGFALVTEYIFRGQTKEVLASWSGRLDFWPIVWEKIIESPIFGHGFYASQRMKWGLSTVDNTYLEVMLGVGLIGLGFFCGAVLTAIVNLWRTRPSRREMPSDNTWRFLWLQLAVLFIFLFIRSLTGPSFQVHNINLSLFALLLVCCSAMVRLQKSEMQN